MTTQQHDHDLKRAAEALAEADALVIAAGAGMGVDSGLPDFRGKQGFWNAYPPYAALKLDFYELANPRWFRDNPALAWGFYGHRLDLYRAARPHAGFAILKRWAEAASRSKARGWFVVTSNVDGQFQRAGFDADRVVEVHGAIDWLQCTAGCGIAPFPADRFQVVIDESTMLAAEPLPACPNCGALARPNILMFGDSEWVGDRTNLQNSRLAIWLNALPLAGEARDGSWLRRPSQGVKLVVVECGAGKSVPTIRRASEALAQRHKGTLIRINVRDHDVPPPHPPGQSIGLPLAALEALQAIDDRL